MNDKKVHRFAQILKDYREIIGLAATLISLAVSLIIFAISYKLAPVVKSVDEVRAQIETNTAAHSDFVTKVELNALTAEMSGLKEDMAEFRIDIRDFKNFLINRGNK